MDKNWQYDRLADGENYLLDAVTQFNRANDGSTEMIELIGTVFSALARVSRLIDALTTVEN